jgi:predicted TIM-barrel fold metal-dependent hydrolase
MRKIDIFCHIQPEGYFRHVQNLQAAKEGLGKRTSGNMRLRDLDHRFRIMDEFGDDYRQVVSVPGPQPAVLAGPDESPAIARVANDGMAELVQKYPERFAGFIAALPMNNPGAAIDEANRAINQLGACGVEVFTNIKGKPLDAPEFVPFWDAMAKHDRPVWMHPSRSDTLTDYTSEKKSRYEIWFIFGYLYETSAAMARLVFSGLFDRHPGIKIITHHLGGMTPYSEGRIGPGWETLGSRTSDEDYSGVLKGLKKPHADYFKMFYADTATFGAKPAMKCGLEYFGADHVLFASDYPFDPEAGQFIRDTIAIIDKLEISDADRAKIYHGNAERLLKLKAA